MIFKTILYNYIAQKRSYYETRPSTFEDNSDCDNLCDMLGVILLATSLILIKI